MKRGKRPGKVNRRFVNFYRQVTQAHLGTRALFKRAAEALSEVYASARTGNQEAAAWLDRFLHWVPGTPFDNPPASAFRGERPARRGPVRVTGKRRK
jgi:hypothetical protein